jgi:predicted NAD/FAD-dependent oxidoreductase
MDKVEKMLADALVVAEIERRSVTSIIVGHRPGNNEVTLTTRIKGKDMAWIAYNKRQLGDLIVLLNAAYSGLKD